MDFEKRKQYREKRREAKLVARELRKEIRHQRRESKFAEGGIVYPVRFKTNRRILLLTRLRRK